MWLSYLAFTSQQTAIFEIKTISARGTHEALLLRVRIREVLILRGRLIPDSREVYFGLRERTASKKAVWKDFHGSATAVSGQREKNSEQGPILLAANSRILA